MKVLKTKRFWTLWSSSVTIVVFVLFWRPLCCFYAIAICHFLFFFKVLIAKIKSLMEHGLYGEAAKLVGDATFDGLRRGMLIGLTVKKKLGMEKPSPSPPSKPSGPKELSDLDRILSELEIENDPRY